MSPRGGWEESATESLQVNMFLEDVQSFVLRSGRNNIVFLGPGGPTRDAREAFGALVHDGGLGNVEREAERLIEFGAYKLAEKGLAVFEVVVDAEEVAERRSRRTLRLKRDRDGGPEFAATTPKERALDTQSVFVPPELGSPSSQRRILRTLRAAGHLAPSFYLQSMADQDGRSAGFDLKAYSAIVEESVARATRKWGWPGRSQWSGRALEFYEMCRYLTWHRSLALVRARLSDGLNAVLARCQVACTLSITGGPGLEEIDSLTARLLVGEARSSDVSDLLFR